LSCITLFVCGTKPHLEEGLEASPSQRRAAIASTSCEGLQRWAGRKQSLCRAMSAEEDALTEGLLIAKEGTLKGAEPNHPSYGGKRLAGPTEQATRAGG